MASKPPGGKPPFPNLAGGAGIARPGHGIHIPAPGPTIQALPPFFSFEADVARAAQPAGISASQITALFRWLQEHQGPLKTTLSVIKTSDNAIKFAKFCFQMERWGLSVAEMVRVLTLVGSLRSPTILNFIEYLLKNGERLSRFFSKTKGARNGLGYLLLVVTLYNNLVDGEYSQAAAKTYKFVMGKAIPWAGAIDTIQGFFPAPSPASTVFLKVLRACDPVGLGGAGVDAMASFAGMIIDGLAGRDFDEDRLNKLAERLKTGPTSFFYKIGEAIPIGEFVYDLKELTVEKWNELGKKTSDELQRVMLDWYGQTPFRFP